MKEQPNTKTKSKRHIYESGKEYSDIVRFPLKLFVDGLDFGPQASIDVVRSAYELNMSPYEMRKLYDWLGKKLKEEPYSDQKVLVIGRLVS
jgi:hypothetical protein